MSGQIIVFLVHICLLWIRAGIVKAGNLYKAFIWGEGHKAKPEQQSLFKLNNKFEALCRLYCLSARSERPPSKRSIRISPVEMLRKGKVRKLR